jgi:arginine deiminase
MQCLVSRGCGRRLVTAFLLVVGVIVSAVRSEETPVAAGCRAEWDVAVEALVHVPGEELFFGVIHPDAALFERPFSVTQAVREHLQYVQQLRQRGIRCRTLEEVLLHGTLDDDGLPVEGPPLKALRKLAREFISVDASGLDETARKNQQAYLDRTVEQLHPRELVRILTLNPLIKLTSTEELNTGFAATYEVRPVMNLYFLRDQLITTDRGVVIGRMNSEQRRLETRIVRFAVEKLGIEPVGVIDAPGFLEGGDFLPAGERVFIAEGLRTNAHAIRQLLEKDAFGTPEVVVVRDAWRQQEQMHLDTYFNLIAPRLAVLAESRMTAEPGSEMRLTMDLYRHVNGRYSRVHEREDFLDYLRQELHMEVIPVSREDQENYGVNFLTVRENEMFVVEGISDAYRNRLTRAGVTVHLVDFRNLTGGYGACHCTVQILRRTAANASRPQPK